MVALHDSLISSAARPLKLRMRPDLVVRRHQYQGQAAWVIKDPVGLKYFRFREEEFAILEWLDGKRSLDALRARYESRFPPAKITVAEIASFVGQLHQSGLVLSLLPDQGPQLKQRSEKRKRQKLLATFTNLLAIRMRGFDPQRILNWLLPLTSWLFTPLAAGCFFLVGLSAVMLVTVQFDKFHARLPAFHEFFAAGNWIYLACALAVTKVLHEFGHGLSCRKFGGECHEIGLMMLVLTPCLYCDVSDSWMLKSKWQRAAIGAAGMYVELIIASFATFIWWFSVPGGLLNNLMLSTMFVCSVSTVVFNANPLLRYDGYYILSDLMEIPNLRQKATTYVNRKLGAWCLGLEEPEDRYLPRSSRILFPLYTVAAIIYRWVVVVAILVFIYWVLAPYGLKAIGQMIAFVVIASMIIQPLWQLKKYFSVPGRTQKIKRRRLYITLGVLGALLLFALLIPLPHRVYSPFVVKPHQAAKVYVEVPGVLKEILEPGTGVQAGDLLARLENIEFQRETAKLEGQCLVDEARLETLARQRHSHSQAGKEADLQYPEVKQALDSAKKQLQQRKEDLARLEVRSPRAGTVLPAELVNGAPRVEGALASWSGTPLERRNRGTWLTEAQPICYVGDPSQVEASLVIDQADVPFVKEGQHVLLMLDTLRGRTVAGTIAEVSKVPLADVAPQLSSKHGGHLDTRTDPQTGQERTASPSYEARVVLDNPDGVLRRGLKGEARVTLAYETLATKMWRYATRTFHFKL